MSRFEQCLEIVLKHEGGWANHPSDPGGATMKGVTIAVFERFKGRDVTHAELLAISDEDLQAIYRKGYWDKVRGDQLPRGLDLVAFDAAVNSGPSQGAKWLQRAVAAVDDGKIGPDTIAAAHSIDPVIAINNACERRLAMLRGLSTWHAFGRGWTARVDDIRVQALGMAGRAERGPGLRQRPTRGFWAEFAEAFRGIFRGN